MLGIDLNLYIIGYSLISITASHGRVNTVTYLLTIGGVEINRRGLIDPLIYRAAIYGYHDIVRLLV